MTEGALSVKATIELYKRGGEESRGERGRRDVGCWKLMKSGQLWRVAISLKFPPKVSGLCLLVD